MTLVELEDGTIYYIDTDYDSIARRVVEYKLRDRLDLRKISKVIVLDDLSANKDSRYHNSSNVYDGIPLKAKTGWSYKWSETKCAEFR